MQHLRVQEPPCEDDAQSASSTIKSVGIACQILEIVAQNAGRLSLKLISNRAGISPSKAHRYVQTLCASGLLSQTHKSGNYDMGVTALRIGLAAVSRIDVINRAGEALSELSEHIQADVFITVWSSMGPTVVRFERWRRPSISMVGPGSAFPLLTTSTGMIFIAYASPDLISDVLQQEIRRSPDLKTMPTLEVIRKYSHVRNAGYAYTANTGAGRQSASAPILTLNDKLIAAVTFVSADPLSIDSSGDHVRHLVAFSRRHSLPKSGFEEPSPLESALAV